MDKRRGTRCVQQPYQSLAISVAVSSPRELHSLMRGAEQLLRGAVACCVDWRNLSTGRHGRKACNENAQLETPFDCSINAVAMRVDARSGGSQVRSFAVKCGSHN